MNPRSTDCEADALTSIPSRRFLRCCYDKIDKSCFCYSKFIIKLANTERFNGCMFYDLFVTVLDLSNVFLLEDMFSFLMKRKLSSEDIKTRPNVLYCATTSAALVLVCFLSFIADICNFDNKYRKPIFKVYYLICSRKIAFLLCYSFFSVITPH